MKRLLWLAFLVVLSSAEAQRYHPRAVEIPRHTETNHRWEKDLHGQGDPRQSNTDTTADEPSKTESETLRDTLDWFAANSSKLRSADFNQITAKIADLPTDLEPIDASNPNLLVRVPAGEAARSIADFLINFRLKQSLSASVDRDSLVLMPLLISKDAQDHAKRIEPGRQALRGLLGTVTHGDFSALDALMFYELRGKTLVVVGHVVERAEGPAFEIRNGDRRQYLPLKGLQDVAKDVGFNVIPLGCETGEAFAVGTAAKITDVDGIEAFKRAISKSGRTSYLELLNDITNEHIRIVIDPRMPDSNLVPIELIDEDGTPVGTPVKRLSSHGAVLPFDNAPQNEPPLNLSIHSEGYELKQCEVSEATLSVSYWYYHMVALCQKYMPVVLSTLLAVLVVVVGIHAPTRSVLGPAPSELNPELRKLVIRNSRNPELAGSIYDGVGTVLVRGVVAFFYGWITITWFTYAILDPSKAMTRVIPMNVFLFVLLLIPITYCVAPYPVQKAMLRVPRWIRNGIKIIGVLFLLTQLDSIIFSVFSLAVTSVLVGVPLIYYRDALDKTLIFPSMIFLIIGCTLIISVVLGWSWFTATAWGYLVVPRPL